MGKLTLTRNDQAEVEAFRTLLSSYAEAVALGIPKDQALADAEFEAYGSAGCSAERNMNG